MLNQMFQCAHAESHSFLSRAAFIFHKDDGRMGPLCPKAHPRHSQRSSGVDPGGNLRGWSVCPPPRPAPRIRRCVASRRKRKNPVTPMTLLLPYSVQPQCPTSWHCPRRFVCHCIPEEPGMGRIWITWPFPSVRVLTLKAKWSFSPHLRGFPKTAQLFSFSPARFPSDGASRNDRSNSSATLSTWTIVWFYNHINESLCPHVLVTIIDSKMTVS